ncbi:hypothetical protein GDO78_012534 [Eleutherodactylus coqui]|uniref:RB1-inducible coiled-coil protein 1 n=1 Tax=Eleutherodactylus coqui TaxID=57060 RepID=A0A8J6F202_ELECQ|nr:hypothetical protein GDO78_012534 [Eleutherodactylus coqui]
MKLYVFLVNTGITLTFDTELAVQTVTDLKHAIQAKYKIAVQHQILVVNGGECMAPDRRVCSYSAGTDTNPIFLFNKEMILCERPPVIPRTTFSAENEMELKVEESLMMPAVFHTVASRTQLAVEMYEVAKKLCSFCEGLVHDEHLQHQGWAAIMANLEDCTHSYQKLLFKFDNAYSKYIQSVDDIKVKLTNLGTAVSVMAKIPLLECLTRHSYRMCLDRLMSSTDREVDELDTEKTTDMVQYDETKLKNLALLASLSTSGEHVSQEVHDDNRTEQENTESLEPSEDIMTQDSPLFNVSLLDWINVQDRPNDVESLVRKCFDSMSRLDPRIIQPFLAECRQNVAKLDNQNMKAIKGLEDRLYALDQMIASCSRLVNEQKELAQGFLANQKRAENLKDPSVLPDLCLSHANQLMIMLTNHRKLLDIKQKCTTAKQELANNLQVRLKWCCFVMLHADQDGEKLQALFRLLTELLERIKIVEALSTVPQMYCLAVVEVVRRKMFTKHYREWANALVKDGKSLYENEKAKRETFGKIFRKSYLRNRLFRGLDSWPSSFCVSNGQFSPQSVTTPRIENATETTTTTSSKSPPSLSLQGPICPSVAIPGPLEELSPDSIDAHTFDFETIPHPNIEQAIKQGSLDLDSLADSPESDFMSAVNEFVIEENPVSPNISDTQSPEMMVESLYSSVINAIDNRRMQDTKSKAKDDSVENASLKILLEKCKTVAQESQANLRNFKEELCYLRKHIQREQSEFANAIKTVSAEILIMIECTKLSLETTLKAQILEERQLLEESYEKRLHISKQDHEVNEETIAKLKLDIAGLKDNLQSKDNEFSAIRRENETFLCLQSEKDEKVIRLESAMREQTCEVQKLKQSREAALEDFKKLHAENEEKLQLLKEELTILEQTHLKELEENLKLRHGQELENVITEHKCNLEKLKNENKLKIDQLQESSATTAQEKESQLQELHSRLSELSDIRCKLEMELAFKEGEIDEMKLMLEESKMQQQDDLKCQLEEKTEVLKKEIETLNSLIQIQKDEHELGLTQLQTVLTTEKNQCISELLLRHEAETSSLQRDINHLTSVYQKGLQAESKLQDELGVLRSQLDHSLKALEKQTEEHEKSVKEQKDFYESSIQKLEEERDHILTTQKLERESLVQKCMSEKEECAHLALKDFDIHRQSVEKELLEKIQLLEQELGKRERLKKENIINELNEKLKSVTQQQERDKDLIETLSEDRARLLEEKKRLDEEVCKLRSFVSSSHTAHASEPSGAFVPDLPCEDEDRMEPTLEISMTAVHDITLSEEKQKILQLERTLQQKEEENKRLNQRLMSQSMSSVASRHSEKIAIREFQVGDLVLIILDERHDNYVLFTVSPTLYFLHSESLSALDLKPASGSSRRPWVLGKVIEKEYCQAKKAQNRFKVPLGTKFYRVKAVPWNKKV